MLDPANSGFHKHIWQAAAHVELEAASILNLRAGFFANEQDGRQPFPSSHRLRSWCYLDGKTS